MLGYHLLDVGVDDPVRTGGSVQRPRCIQEGIGTLIT